MFIMNYNNTKHICQVGFKKKEKNNQIDKNKEFVIILTNLQL